MPEMKWHCWKNNILLLLASWKRADTKKQWTRCSPDRNYDFSNWKDIVEVYPHTNCVLGLRRNGRVIAQGWMSTARTVRSSGCWKKGVKSPLSGSWLSTAATMTLKYTLQAPTSERQFCPMTAMPWSSRCGISPVTMPTPMHSHSTAPTAKPGSRFAKIKKH